MGSIKASPSSSIFVATAWIASKWSEVWLMEEGVMSRLLRSLRMASSYSPFSLEGLVSSNRSSIWSKRQIG